MYKTISAIVCFVCLSLISNLAVADKPEWVEKPNWVEKKSWFQNILSPFQHPDFYSVGLFVGPALHVF